MRTLRPFISTKPRTRGSRASLGLLAAALMGILLAITAHAQLPGLQGAHGQAARVRALETRLAEADAVVIGRVADVQMGRIGVTVMEPLYGEPGERFEIKRSPSRPARLAAGDVALLFLRGARTPYLLVDRPGELTKPEDEAALALWTAAVRDLVATPPEARLALYEAWLDGASEVLAGDAMRAIAARDSGDPLPDDFLARRVTSATRADRRPALRTNSALVALLDARGAALLLDALPGGDTADPALVRVALAAGGRLAPESGWRAALRSLQHPDPAVRRAALRAEGPYRGVPEITQATARLAREDPDPELRALAHQVAARSRAAARSD